ncbi:hypothetical protein BBJ29_000279 [Phytophthora kernoviae]|uniref:Peptidase S1 domain-containing protein n=1 Tax=Phytophthora kernoviae TaxID=325452 RepID=A0A3F2S146_9STRA|nr:hypothetical protein BBJ29_000279 [Phytophthora kernoviae]RLN67708.1 hypothetical protein BBP00_00001459 [Phytophthora kernoviae]
MKIVSALAVASIALTLDPTSAAKSLAVDRESAPWTQVPKGEKTYVSGVRSVADNDNFCGGALISPSHILTTTSCITKNIRWASVGSQYYTGTEDGEQIKVVSFIPHPNNTGYVSDFLILELEVETNIEPVKLDSGEKSVVQPGLLVGRLGWNDTTAEAVQSKFLHSVEVQLIGNKECSQEVTVDNTMMCSRGMIPDILLDGDRLNMLLDIVCADYITACYASRENGKRVVFKALEKLYISVHAGAPTIGTDTRALRPAQDPLFQDRARRFYEELAAEFRARKRAAELSMDANTPSSRSSSRVLDDSTVREVMKPRLLQIVEEMCRERDRHLVFSGGPISSSSVSSSAEEQWKRYLNCPFYGNNHVIEKARVLEEHIEDHSDVVYWQLFPTYIWPVYVGARDLCLLRYWRMEPDGSYFICFQSTTHAECPPNSGSVRANIMGGGFIISPRVQEDSDNHFEECWVTLTIQMNPNGWVNSRLARSWYYVHSYGMYFLEMITAITASEGRQIQRPVTAPLGRRASIGGAPFPSQQIVSEKQFPMLERYRTDLTVLHGLPTKFWSEPNGSGFLVRGPQYLSSKMKVPSARQALRLVNVELYKSNEAVEHIGLSSFVGEGFDQKLTPGTPEDPPFIFIINFMLPGPPHHSLVLYFTPEDPDELKKNSVFADLCHELLRGPSDEFRTQRLKLIPRVVQGTWPIREGVGTTPAILGTKIYQNYYQGKSYLEADYDIGSSTVATGILNLLLGFSRDLIIDLAFVIEAQSAMELPERILGTVRLDCIDLRHAVQYTKKKKGMDKNK